MAKKYFIYSILVLFLINQIGVGIANAEVCIKDSDSIDVITLLDASERDLSTLSSCELLVKDLYSKLDERDNQAKGLTDQLISAKQDVLIYKASAAKWRRITLYTTAAGIAVVVIKLVVL